MKIQKIGHCCLVVEALGVRVLTDPGMFTTAQTDQQGLDAVLLTHEQADHVHLDSLKVVLDRNPKAVVLTNTAVGHLLAEADIPYTLLVDGGTYMVGDLAVCAYESPHAEIYEGVPRVLNTGFFIGDKLFYPGDAFIDPKRSVDVLALPVSAPWLRISDAVDYARLVNPRVCFPVHDAIISVPAMFHGMPQRLLEPHGIGFHPLLAGESAEF